MQLFSSFRGVLKWFGQKVMTGNIPRKFVFDGFSLIHRFIVLRRSNTSPVRILSLSSRKLSERFPFFGGRFVLSNFPHIGCP